jgi:hypothetical protein
MRICLALLRWPDQPSVSQIVTAPSSVVETLLNTPLWSLMPAAHRKYLEWLASGKCDPDQDIGYVFLYFTALSGG